MKKSIIILFLILSFGSKVFSMSFNEAAQQNKLIVLYLYLTTCGACRSFEPIYSAIEAEFSSKYNFVKEIAQESALATKLRVDSVPAVYIINPQANTAARIKSECIFDRACFEATLQSYR